METSEMTTQRSKSKTLLKKPAGIKLKSEAIPKEETAPKQAAPKVSTSAKRAGIPKSSAAAKAITAAKAEVVIKPIISEFKKLLNKLRSKAEKAPTMEDITNEVELIRNKRYAIKK